MGYLHKNHCHATLAGAVQADCASYPVMGTSGTDAVQATCVGVTANTLTIDRLVNGTSAGTFIMTPAYATCDESAHYNDLLTLFGMFLGAVVIVLCAKLFILRHFTGNH